MNPKVIALFSADRAVQETVVSAAMESRHGLRLADVTDAAVKILLRDHRDVDLFIIDLDEDIHGVPLLAALTFEDEVAPIVLLTSFEPGYCTRLATATGVKACLGKPIAKEQIADLIHRLIDGHSPDKSIHGCATASEEKKECCGKRDCGRASVGWRISRSTGLRRGAAEPRQQQVRLFRASLVT